MATAIVLRRRPPQSPSSSPASFRFLLFLHFLLFSSPASAAPLPLVVAVASLAIYPTSGPGGDATAVAAEIATEAATTATATEPSSSSPSSSSSSSSLSSPSRPRPPPRPASRRTMPRTVVFSDVDGTLVHYPPRIPPEDHREGGGGSSSSSSSSSESDLIRLPPSKTGLQGALSVRTLELCQRLREGDGDGDGEGEGRDYGAGAGAKGAKLVLVSGMRTTTLFGRLPFLPRADAYASESGGRIFYPRPVPKSKDAPAGEGPAEGVATGLVEGLVATPAPHPGLPPSYAAPFALAEDAEWRRVISHDASAGSDGYDDSVPPELRRGALWDFARVLTSRGYVLDESGYATQFRVNRKRQSPDVARTFDDFVARCKRTEGVPEGLGCSVNLGCVDVYPAVSGKRNCAEYLTKKLLGDDGEGDGEGDDAGRGGTSPPALKTCAICLCDDDNDLEMALACRKAFFPSVASESVRAVAALESRQDQLIVVEDEAKGLVGPKATEAALEKVVEEVRLAAESGSSLHE